MDEKLEKTNSKWIDAAQDAVFLSLFTVGTELVSGLITNGRTGDPGLLANVLGFVLWFIKFGGSIWFLLRCLKRFAASDSEGSIFAQGMRTCLLSSIICAAFTFLMYTAIFPGLVDEVFAQVTNSLAGTQLPDEAETMLLRVQDNFGQYMAFAIFFWGLLCGLVFSAILAPSAQRSVDIFGGSQLEDDDNDEEDELA